MSQIDSFPTLEKKFSPIGPLNIVQATSGFSVDVAEVGKQERFELTLSPATQKLHVLDVRPKDRHLLLFVEYDVGEPTPKREKILCGFDERHLFVAAVDLSASGVDGAKQSLKPDAVVQSQKRHRVKRKKIHRRKNAGFIRQGEWFFVPAPDMDPPLNLLLRDEPLRRGAGKPHLMEMAYRRGGDLVYVSRAHPNGVTEGEYRRLLRRNRTERSMNWTPMRRDPEVYAKGRIRHPDHKTLRLRGWHRVYVNNESVSEVIAFLD